jgi:beta-lactamase regulating signal transducer with metallopeptidase domain
MTMDILFESAIRISLLALGVALVLRTLGIHAPRVAHRVWTAVVVVMLVLPTAVAWGLRFDMPVLASAPAVSHLFAPAPDDMGAHAPGRPAAIGATADRGPGADAWRAVLVTVYAAGVVLLLARLAAGMWRLDSVRRTAMETQGHLTHPACITPITVGLFTPAILLPCDWTQWDAADVSAALAHEQEHVRRRDPLVLALALVNRAVFWFHPLAWWLPRELSRVSEQACDAAVIARGHDPDVYASCLLRSARRAAAAGGRLVPMAVAMAAAGLQERLRMLARPQTAPSRAQRLGAVGACAALVVMCGAAAPVAAQRPAARPVQAGWAVVTSDHFDVFHDGLPADRVRVTVREAETAYARLSAALRYEIPSRIAIILVNRDRNLPASAAEARSLAERGGAPNRHRVVLSLESLAERPDIVVHELSHQFAFEIMPATSRRAPTVLEGLAEYQRGAWRADDLALVRAGAAGGAVPPVAVLDDDSRHWMHAVFDYVDAEYGAEGIRRLVFALRAQDTLARAIPVAFDVTLDQFDERFRDYLTARFGQR